MVEGGLNAALRKTNYKAYIAAAFTFYPTLYRPEKNRLMNHPCSDQSYYTLSSLHSWQPPGGSTTYPLPEDHLQPAIE